MKLRCIIGLHSWRYNNSVFNKIWRVCRHCGKHENRKNKKLPATKG